MRFSLLSSLPSLPGGLTIHLLAGTHDVSGSSLELNSTDSGTPDSPITYAGEPGAVLSAGLALQPSLWQAVVPGSHPRVRVAGVMSYNLSAAGVTNFGTIHANPGLGSCPAAGTGSNGRLEVFINDVAQVIARYPNVNSSTGYWNWENIATVKNDTTAFTYASDRPSQWVNETGDAWVWGYWSFDWADSVVKVCQRNREPGSA